MAFSQTMVLASLSPLTYSSPAPAFHTRLNASFSSSGCTTCRRVSFFYQNPCLRRSWKSCPKSLSAMGRTLLGYFSGSVQCWATNTYTVEIDHNGRQHVLKVPEDETILSVAIEEGLDVPYDCKLGVCMTCPAKLEKGKVDQTGGMLSDDVIERGYALMCASYPLSDCVIRTIPEDELLSLQLATAGDA